MSLTVNQFFMRKIVAMLICTFLFAGCQRTNTVQVVKSTADTTIQSRKGISKIEKSNFDKENVRLHLFSDLKRMDTFKLSYNSKNLEDSMCFQIISSTGAILFEKHFDGGAFYDYDRPWYLYVTDPARGDNYDSKTMSKEIADSLQSADISFINQKIQDFFSDNRFYINPQKVLDRKMVTSSNFGDIENETSVVGFTYSLYSPGYEMIAFSKKKNKVITIVASD